MKIKSTAKDTYRSLYFDVLICLLLTTAIFIVYWQVHSHEFLNFDDTTYVSSNPIVSLGLTLKGFLWALSFSNRTYWHPVTWLSHMLDVELFGLNSGMHHIMNMCLHTLNSLLLFVFLRSVTGSSWRSAFVAALFALHPINVDSVAWLAERKNLLSSFFWMLSLIIYIYYIKRPGILRYSGLLCVYSLGLLSKPTIMTLPFVFLLLDYWPLHRFEFVQKPYHQQDVKRMGTRYQYQGSALYLLILEKVPLFILSLGSFFISSLSVKHGGMSISLKMVPLGLRMENAIVSYPVYLVKMLWPHHLTFFYPFPNYVPIWQVIGSLGIIFIISLLALKYFIRAPYLIMGWLWYLGTMVPMLGLVQGGLWPAIAERWAYLPFIGMYIILAWGIPDVFKGFRYKGVVLPASAIIILLILMTVSWRQVGYWKNVYTLNKHALDVSEKNYVAHTNLAEVLIDQDDLDGATMHCTEALKINPNYADAYNQMGVTLKKRGDLNESMKNYIKAIQIDPNNWEAYNNLGIAYIMQGQKNKGSLCLAKAIELNPENLTLYINMGNCLASQGKATEAIRIFTKAIEIKPDLVEARYSIGTILLSQGKINESIEQFRKVLAIDPSNLNARRNIASLLALQNNLESTGAELKKQLEKDPRNENLYVNLGEMYKRSGDLVRAEENFRQVVLINSKNILALNRLSEIYSIWEEYDKALDAMKKLIEVQPDIANVYYNIACIYARQNMTKESIGWLNQAIDRGFKNWDQIKEDPDLASIRNTAFINELIKNH
jgi:tetratricopeptide (TPR) repeat protein